MRVRRIWLEGMASFPNAPGQAPPGMPPGIGQGQPPGLWQTPGQFPAAAGAAFEGRESDLQKEISWTIEAQVARMIEETKKETESKVKIELKQIMEVMTGMNTRLDQLLAQLDGMDQPKAAEPPMDAEEVNRLLSKVEQQWGQEIRTLKQELHQTILAHNHNADLIKHHKDTIDSLRENVTRLGPSGHSSTRTAEITEKMKLLDARLKQRRKEPNLERIFERLTFLEQRIASVMQYRGLAMADPASIAGALASMGMMPPGMGVPSMGVPGKGAGAKGGSRQKPGVEKAAYRCPTDEEVQERLSKLSHGGQAEAAVPDYGGEILYLPVGEADAA